MFAARQHVWNRKIKCSAHYIEFTSQTEIDIIVIWREDYSESEEGLSDTRIGSDYCCFRYCEDCQKYDNGSYFT
jgi:hypothetical protein